MKIKENFLLRQVADTWVVMPIGQEMLDFNGMLTLNETGAFLWQKLQEGADLEGLVKALTAEYDVSAEIARADAEGFCQKLLLYSRKHVQMQLHFAPNSSTPAAPKRKKIRAVTDRPAYKFETNWEELLL